MAGIIVLGGTGYAGRHIVAEAVLRGHDVTAIARLKPEAPIEGAKYVQGSALNLSPLAETFAGADAVVSALSPRGDLTYRAREALNNLIDMFTGTTTRLGVIGGAGGSLAAPGGPRLFDLNFPEEYRHEAQVALDSLAMLEASDPALDWFFVHPAESFGPWAEGERTGYYRDGGEVVVRDPEGRSFISGADFAVAVVDEIEQGNHRRGHFSIGY